MDTDNNNMIEIIKKEIANGNFLHKDLLNEIIGLFKKASFEESTKYEILLELYRYTKLSNTRTSIDHRIDRSIKSDALNNVKEIIKSNEFSQEKVNTLKNINELCLEYFLNPLKILKEEQEFSLKNPNAKL